MRGARLAPSTFPFFFASDASGTDVEASGDDTHVKLYLQGYGCIVYVSVGDNYGDDTNDVEIRKHCLGRKGCKVKDVDGKYRKLGDTYIGEGTAIRKTFDENIFDKYIQISNTSNVFCRSGRRRLQPM